MTLNSFNKQVEAQGYSIDREPTEEGLLKYPRIASFHSSISYLTFQTPFDSDFGKWLSKAMYAAFGKEPIKKEPRAAAFRFRLL